MDFFVPVATLFFGVLLGAWFNHYIKRPRLTATGGGGGGGPVPGFRQNFITIHNVPGLFGLRLEESMVFGKTVHGRIEKGLTVDRQPANSCTARLIDKETGQEVAPLWWRSADQEEMHRRVTIPSGESRGLMLFVARHDERLKYFAFQPEGASITPKTPPAAYQFQGSRKFVVEIRYSYGRQRLTVPVSVEERLDGHRMLRYGKEGGGLSF